VNTVNPAPFQRVWDAGTSAVPVLQSCHDVGFTYYNREEQGQTPSGGDFSPKPPTSTFGLCTEVNTLTLYRSGTNPDDGRLFGAKSTAAALAIDNFDAGWLKISWAQQGDTLVPPGTGVLLGTDASDNPVTVHGLPVIGFSASRNVNTVDVQIDGLNVYSAVMGSNVPQRLQGHHRGRCKEISACPPAIASGQRESKGRLRAPFF